MSQPELAARIQKGLDQDQRKQCKPNGKRTKQSDNFSGDETLQALTHTRALEVGVGVAGACSIKGSRNLRCRGGGSCKDSGSTECRNAQ